MREKNIQKRPLWHGRNIKEGLVRKNGYMLDCREKFGLGRECPNPLEMPSRGRQSCLEIDNRLEQAIFSSHKPIALS